MTRPKRGKSGVRYGERRRGRSVPKEIEKEFSGPVPLRVIHYDLTYTIISATLHPRKRSTIIARFGRTE